MAPLGMFMLTLVGMLFTSPVLVGTGAGDLSFIFWGFPPLFSEIIGVRFIKCYGKKHVQSINGPSVVQLKLISII